MTKHATDGSGHNKKYSGSALAANTALASVASGGAVLASVPSMTLAILVGAIGAVVAYTVINEIPGNGKS